MGDFVTILDDNKGLGHLGTSPRALVEEQRGDTSVPPDTGYRGKLFHIENLLPVLPIWRRCRPDSALSTQLS